MKVWERSLSDIEQAIGHGELVFDARMRDVSCG